MDIDLDKLSFDELRELRDEVNNRIAKHYRIKRQERKNPCIGCKHHCYQYLIDGSVEWTCAYTSCKYDFSDARPSEE